MENNSSSGLRSSHCQGLSCLWRSPEVDIPVQWSIHQVQASRIQGHYPPCPILWTRHLACEGPADELPECFSPLVHSFHSSFPGVSRSDQYGRRLTTADFAKRACLPEDIGTLLREYRLLLLGHVAHMDVARIPQQVLFGELEATRPRHGPKKRWRDTVLGDLQSLNIPESKWYQLAQDHLEWRRQIYQHCLPLAAPKDFHSACGRAFRRSGDLKRHLKYFPP